MKKNKTRFLECYLCKLFMKSNKVSNLRRHMNLHGPLVQCFKCLECGVKFQNKSNLKIHWKNVHKSLADNNIPPKMMRSSRKAKNIRSVRLVKSIETSKQNNDVEVPNTQSQQSFATQEQQSPFGEPPVLMSSKEAQQFIFGHTAFGSHLPSFEMSSAVMKKINETATRSDDIREVFYVTKRIDSISNDVPEILQTLGLRKIIYSPPKCYDNKKKIEHSITTVTLCATDLFNCDLHFGQLD